MSMRRAVYILCIPDDVLEIILSRIVCIGQHLFCIFYRFFQFCISVEHIQMCVELFDHSAYAVSHIFAAVEHLAGLSDCQICFVHVGIFRCRYGSFKFGDGICQNGVGVEDVFPFADGFLQQAEGFHHGFRAACERFFCIGDCIFILGQVVVSRFVFGMLVDFGSVGLGFAYFRQKGFACAFFVDAVIVKPEIVDVDCR